MSEELNINEMKSFIVERMVTRENFDFNIDIVKAVEEVIDHYEEFINQMHKTDAVYTNDDEMSHIVNKTGYKTEFIDRILWQKYCYEMKQGIWEYNAEECIKCKGSKMLLKEVEDTEFADKVVCQECGYEMVFGDKGLITYKAEKDWVQYLVAKISFPFEAEIIEYQKGDSVLRQGDKLKVHKIEDEDDLYGVIVSVRKGRKKYYFPLIDLEPLNLDEESKRAIEEYKEAFSSFFE